MTGFLRNTAMACAVGVVTLTGASHAQAEFPERPITMIVAYSAGGGTDVAARSLAPFIETYLGGSITVVNKPGAGGEVGFTEISQAEPDGYTIGFLNTPNLVTIPIERDTRYELENFSPIANVVDDPGGFHVRQESEFQTLEALIAYAKENPNAVTFGTTGIGSDDHLAALALQRQAGIEMTHVPFPGASAVRAALLGGHITLGVFNMGEAVSYAEEGLIRSLGQMAEERWSEMPEVPTFREQGYDIVQGSTRGIGAPAGVPEEILQQVAAAIEKAINDPEFQKVAAEQSLPLRFLAPDAYKTMLKTARDSYLTLWEKSPWAAQ